MSCLRPKKGFCVGKTPKGKDKYKITSYLTDHVENSGDGVWKPVDSDFVTPGNVAIKSWIPIPCGKCYNCKMQYAKQWTLRLLLEKTKFPDNLCWFLTLTYNNEELPYCYSADSLGNAVQRPTLRPRDMQLFFKRLRRKYGSIRIFYCGEYGDRNKRPHYHAIVFGLPINDLVCCGIGKNGDLLFNSPSLDAEWYRLDGDFKHNLGFVVVGNVTAKSCAYVARYCLKKAKSVMSDPYIVPEFVRMSRRPGIASDFVDQARPLMQVDGQEYFLPRFFLKKLEDLDPCLASQYHSLVVEIGKNAQNNLVKIGYADPFGSGRTAKSYLDKLFGIEYNRLASMEIRNDI